MIKHNSQSRNLVHRFVETIIEVFTMIVLFKFSLSEVASKYLSIYVSKLIAEIVRKTLKGIDQSFEKAFEVFRYRKLLLNPSI